MARSRHRGAIKLIKAAAFSGLFVAPISVSGITADKNGVAPTSISLPSGPGSVEGLGETFQPMLNTGSPAMRSRSICRKVSPATP